MERTTGLTYDDLSAFPDDGLRRELIDGELIVSPSPKTRHQVVSLRLTLALGNHVASHGGATLFQAPLDIVLSLQHVVEPDLFVVLDSQADIITEPNIKGAPALVIEIVSDSRYDRVRKRDLYERFAVPDYWIVDPENDRVEVLRLSGTRYARPQVLEASDRLETPLLPGFSLDIATLLAR